MTTGLDADDDVIIAAMLQPLLDGKFIDYPIVYRAQRVLRKVAAIRAREAQ